jgi:predicted permease
MSGWRWRRAFRLDTGRQRVERDVDEELAFHLEMRTRKLAARGLDPRTAREQALRQFGDLDSVRAECLDIDYRRERDVQRARHFDELRQDIGYALRALRQNPVFTIVVLLSLALGIGANTAVFTLVDAVVFRSLPVAQPHELVAIGDTRAVGAATIGSAATDLFSYPLYIDLRDRATRVRDIVASGRTGRLDVSIASDGGVTASEPERVRGRLVSANYFSMLGVRAAVGRTLLPDDDRAAGGSPVAVISHAYWQRRLGGDSAILGRRLVINGSPFTIVGVAGEGFHGEVVGGMTELWIPLTMQPAVMPNRRWLDDRNVSWLLLLGRLAPGATIDQAHAELTALTYQSIEGADPDAGVSERGDTIPVASGARGFSSMRDTYTAGLATLMAAVGIVLLIVCANVANLMLARGTARGREIGVRMALGAARWRVARQLLTEGAVVAAIGGALGLAFASWGSRTLLKLASGGPRPIPLHFEMDARVLGFTALLSLTAVVLFALGPALRATRVELATVLHAHSRGVTGTAGGARGRWLTAGKLLVMSQVALSLMLLVGTSMLTRSTRALETIDTGLARDELLIVTIDAARTGFDNVQAAELVRRLIERAKLLPGVTAASVSENGIFSGTESATRIEVQGFTARTRDDSVVNYDRVGSGYFETIGARVLQGRGITALDRRIAPRVVVINETMAKQYVPTGDAVGRRLRLIASDQSGQRADLRADSLSYEIVGVVRDVTDHGLRDDPAPRAYFALEQGDDQPFYYTLEIRTRDPARLAEAARREMLAENAALSVISAEPLTVLMRQSISQDRLVARVTGFFGVLALCLAALGLYGVMAYTTLRRTSEFGLRMALGAQPATVSRMVLGEAMTLVAGGVLIGLPLALFATRLLENQLFGVALFDPVSVGVALVVLTASATVAGYLPAARAGRVGPLVALRAE